MKANKISTKIFPFELEIFHCKKIERYLIHNIQKFLNQNYIEDIISSLRFNYSHELLFFIISCPDFSEFSKLIVRFKRKNNICGFINSQIAKLINQRFFYLSSEINFYCLDKKFRKKNFSNDIINKINSRTNTFGIFSGIFTTSLKLLDSYDKDAYMYSIMNHMKLFRLGFKSENFSDKKIKSFHLNLNSNLRNYNNFLNNFKINNIFFSIYKHYVLSELKYWFRTINGVTYLLNDGNLTNNFNFLKIYVVCYKILNCKSKFIHSAYELWHINFQLEKNFFEEAKYFFTFLKIDIFFILHGKTNKILRKIFNFKKSFGKIRFCSHNLSIITSKNRVNGLMIF